MKTIFVNKKKLLQSVPNQMHCKKTANILSIFATSRLVTHFCCGHNVRRFARSAVNPKKNQNEIN